MFSLAHSSRILRADLSHRRKEVAYGDQRKTCEENGTTLSRKKVGTVRWRNRSCCLAEFVRESGRSSIHEEQCGVGSYVATARSPARNRFSRRKRMPHKQPVSLATQ